MDLFELLKHLFDKNYDWSSVTKYDKESNYFMINRIMSIKFPLQANELNKIGIDTANCVDIWRQYCIKLNGYPNWIYTKTKKQNLKEWKPKKETIDYWRKMNEVGSKDYDYLLTNHKQKLYEELKNVEKMLNLMKE